MGIKKNKKFTVVNIRKITGGKDPVKIVEEFILRRGFSPDECAKERTGDLARWMLSLNDEEELEILLEGLRDNDETTIYMGINALAVPLKNAQEVLVSALETADGLIGVKVSLVGHYLVLSATLGMSGISVEELDYYYTLIIAQLSWFRESLSDDLGWEMLPE